MPGKAAKVVITEQQQEILQQLVRSRSCPQGLAPRARIILLAFDRWQNGPIADHLGASGTPSGSGDAAGPTPSIP